MRGLPQREQVMAMRLRMAVSCVEFLPDGVEQGDGVVACGGETAVWFDEVEHEDGGVSEGGEAFVGGSWIERIEDGCDAGVVWGHAAPRSRAISAARHACCSSTVRTGSCG